MTRIPVAMLAGAAMTLLLFWLLALLVSPPEAQIEVLEMRMPLTRVEAPEEPEVAEPAVEATPSTPPEAVVPPPMPEPAPLTQSEMALPDPELPPTLAETPQLDSELPELREEQPKLEPQPDPEPEPQPSPEPRAKAASPAQQAEPAESSSEKVSVSPASSEPLDVGQLTPTERVPPAYPARAQRRGLEGHVELAFVIRADGSVDASSLRVLSARPRNVFDEAAREAVSRWRFEPSTGLRRARQRLEFQLR